jgi:hypothetical protein
MTPEEFRSWYERLKAIDPSLNDTKLAHKLDVDQPRIGKWRRGEVKIAGFLWRALEHLEAELRREQAPKRGRRSVRSEQTGSDTDAG